MFIEKERSYVFRSIDIDNLAKVFPSYSSNEMTTTYINDYYLNKNLRLRHLENNYLLENKSDNKKEEGREETSTKIDWPSFNLLRNKTKLIVNKKRRILHKENNKFIVTVDIVSHPINILIVEVESLDGITLPSLEDFFTGRKFATCPLSAWDYFKRKIAICGAPSSGKTSTAQWLTNKINTEFHGIAFCPIEYATSFIQKYDKYPNIHDQYMIWESQNSRERDALDKCNMVISDSPTFLSYVYGLLTSKDIDINDKNILLSKLYKRSLEGLYEYEQIFFLNLVRYKENGIRYNTEDEAIKIHDLIREFLENHGIKFGDYTYNNKEQMLSDILYLNEI